MRLTATLKQGVLTLFLIALALLSSPLLAEQKKTFGIYDIHYVSSNTAMLTPAIAKIYKIQRSKSRGIVTIAVRNTEKEAASEALVRGSVRNPIGQMQSLDFTKVVDQQAIYYLATFSFADEQTMRFDILVSPDGVADTYVVDFKQQFFID
jgi:hypothetical protein